MTDTTGNNTERQYSPNTIYIEGLELAGKSTICRLLRDYLKAEYRHCSFLSDNPIYNCASALHVAQKVKSDTLGGIFLGSVMRDLERYTPPDHFVVQDSTSVLRSIAYHSVIGDPGLADAFSKLLPRCPHFGASFVLWSSNEVRLKRLKGRISRHHDLPKDLLVRDEPDKFARMQDIMIETAKEFFDAEVVDTSNMEQEGEKERLVEYLASKLRQAASQPNV
ncbi:MAG: hypothetical protein IKR48_06715 [Kiritimatiellae bacterium]|nr:hypothetical protein [Kiritimatiellia bacterium]